LKLYPVSFSNCISQVLVNVTKYLAQTTCEKQDVLGFMDFQTESANGIVQAWHGQSLAMSPDEIQIMAGVFVGTSKQFHLKQGTERTG
jgi:hypothetical protein